MTDEKLFTEFPPVSTEQWEATINKDLKGADYEKKLVWRTDEGFQVRPYYRAENMQDLDYLKTMPNEFPYTRGTKARDNHWDIVQEIEEADPAKANAIAVDALKRGATCIAFNAANVESDEALATLLKDIDLNVNGVQFNHVKSYLDLMKRFVNFVEAHNFDKEKVSGSLNFDPLVYRLRHNKFWKSAEEDMQQAVELLEMNGCMKNFKVINVNGIALHNAGATIVQELAYTLSLANEYLAFCTGKGIKPEKVASRMQLTLSVGSNYFMEIAKLRATRLLWSTMVAQYKPECDCAYKIHINTVASTWNKTLYDPYVNMLRSTTEGMSSSGRGLHGPRGGSRRRLLLRREPHQLHRGECLEALPKRGATRRCAEGHRGRLDARSHRGQLPEKRHEHRHPPLHPARHQPIPEHQRDDGRQDRAH